MKNIKSTKKVTEDINTMDMLNKMIEIQKLKVDNYSKPTEESELAMQNMIELLKFRYDILHTLK
ncbi:MAG: hypothetical protein IJH65_05480 [Methanobrevibacter sp.]|nr:hypothetical protein [Methanobrevibacter sp.]